MRALVQGLELRVVLRKAFGVVRWEFGVQSNVILSQRRRISTARCFTEPVLSAMARCFTAFRMTREGFSMTAWILFVALNSQLSSPTNCSKVLRLFSKIIRLGLLLLAIGGGSTLNSVFAADPGAHPDFGGIQKKISIQRGTAISVWVDRGDVAKSSAMSPVGDGTWEYYTDLTPGATYNFMFFAVTGSTAPTGLSPNSVYNDTPPTDFTGTIRFPTSTSSTTITGAQTASFGKAGSGDDRRVFFVPSGNTTFYVFANFAHTPNPPQNIFAQPVDTGTIRLVWNYPKDNWNSTTLADVVAGGQYFIYFSTTGSAGPFTLITSTPGFATEFTHKNLNGNLTYFYVITSSDAYRGATQTGKVDQVGIDDNFVMAFPDFAQVSGRPRGATPTYFRVDSIDWEKIGGDNALVYLTPWEEDARFYEQKIKGRIVKVYLP